MALVAVLPRVDGLSGWWVNPDEGTYFAIFTRTSGVWREIAENAHPPLYYVVMRVLAFATHDFVWFRVASLGFGVVAVLTTWLAAAELAGRGRRGTAAGLVASLIVAFAPAAVELSTVIRPYTLLLTLLTASLWLLLRYLRTDSRRALLGYVLCVSLALLTHYSAFLAFGAFGALVLHEGLSRAWGTDRWRRLLLAHGVPVVLLLSLYVFHLRRLMGGTLAEAALNGWLSSYMVGSPSEAWLAFSGFLKLVGAPWLVGPLAVSFFAGLARSASTRDRGPLVLGVAGLGIGVLGSWMGLYPLGPTRHSIWLMAIVVPVVAWPAAEIVSLRGRTRAWMSVAAALLLITGDTVGRELGMWRTRGAAPEHVLRRAELAHMRDLVDPDECAGPIVMSRQTFHLLVPLLPRDWESAAPSSEGSAVHFRIGRCDVLAATGWDLRAIPGVEGDASYLLAVLDDARESFANQGLRTDSTAIVLAGGWALPIVSDLAVLPQPEPVVLDVREVPGLVALTVDLDAYRRSVAAFGPTEG